MKRILTILFLFAFVQSFGQKTQQSLGTKNTMIVALSDLKIDSLIFMPERTDTNFVPYKEGAVVYRKADKAMYYWAAHWRPMGGSFVQNIYKRNDSLFYQKGGAETFVAKWTLRTLSVPTGMTATQIGDSVAITTTLNGLIRGNGTGFGTATIDSPLYYSSGRLRISKAGIDSSGYLSFADWQAFNGKVAPTRQVATAGSLTGGGALTQDRTIQLVNDNGAPGNNKYYGTNGAGSKGFYDIPGSVDSVKSVFGRKEHVIADSTDYQVYYSGVNHTHAALLPPGGRLGEVLRKRSDNDYDAVWQTGGGGSDKYITGFTVSGTTYKTIVGYYSDGTTTAPTTWFDNTNDTNSTANIDTVSLSNRINAKQMYGDTSTYDATRFWVQQQSYLTNITGKVQAGTNVTITGAGTTVSPYIINSAQIDSTSLSSRINGKQNVSDTATLDATRYWVLQRGYLVGEDTTSLSNRVNGKQNIADTSTLDATRYWVNTQGFLKGVDTASLSNRINQKLNISDSSSTIATRHWVGQNYKPISYVPAWSEITGKPTNVSYFTNDAGYLTNITGKVAAGSNVTITGAGTTASPYTISSSGGGLGTVTYNANYNKILVQDTATGNVYRQSAAVLNLTSPTNGQTLVYNDGVWVNGAAASSIQFNEWTFTATAGQATFTNDTLSGKHVRVWRERELQIPGSDVIIGSTTITFSPSLTAGERVYIEASNAAAWVSSSTSNGTGGSTEGNIVFTSYDAGVTESPTGTWNASSGILRLSSSENLSGDGYIQMEYGSNTDAVVLGLDNNSTLETWTSGGNCMYKAGFFWTGGNLYTVYEGALSTTQINHGLLSGTIKVRMVRSGSTLYLYRSTDGTNFTLSYTFPGTYSGDLFVKATISNAGTKILNPKSLGF